jgi:hypothetical protein
MRSDRLRLQDILDAMDMDVIAKYLPARIAPRLTVIRRSSRTSTGT